MICLLYFIRMICMISLLMFFEILKKNAAVVNDKMLLMDDAVRRMTDRQCC